MKKSILSFLFIISSLTAKVSFSQAYLDLAQAAYWASPGRNDEPKKFNQLRLGATLPLANKKDSSVFVFNPIWEERWLKKNDDSRNVNLRSFVSLLSYTRNLNNKWSLMIAAIPRWNGEPAVQFSDGFQMGGLFLVTRKFRPGLHVKAGMYYNKEFFGNFFLPLLGIDWKINDKMNLFGILPGNMVFEHKFREKLAWGGVFRTFTNSYRIVEGSLIGFDNFVRVNDIQGGVYGDFYITKKVVFNLEAGHTIFRNVSSAVEGESGKNNLHTLAESDNFYFRASLQYRLRFR